MKANYKRREVNKRQFIEEGYYCNYGYKLLKRYEKV